MLSIKVRAKGMSAAKLREEQESKPWLTRDGLLDAVSAVRKHRVCGYLGSRCDCKFGLKVKLVPNPLAVKHTKASTKIVTTPMKEVIDHASEATGCPELYVVLDLLSKMTKKEFDDLMRRPQRPKPSPKAALKKPCVCAVGVKRKDAGFVFKPKHPNAHPRRDADWTKEVCPICRGSGKV